MVSTVTEQTSSSHITLEQTISVERDIQWLSSLTANHWTHKCFIRHSKNSLVVKVSARLNLHDSVSTRQTYMIHTFLPLVMWIIHLHTADTTEQLGICLTAKSQQGLKTKLPSTTVWTIKQAEGTFNVFIPASSNVPSLPVWREC